MLNRKTLTALVLGAGVALVACSGGKGTTIEAGASGAAPAEASAPAGGSRRSGAGRHP